MNDLTILTGAVMLVAFAVNIIVQLTKEFVPIPTKLWCILVSTATMLTLLFAAASKNCIELDLASSALAIAGSFVVAFIAMYGFDTIKELWERFKKGENINDNN